MIAPPPGVIVKHIEVAWKDRLSYLTTVVDAVLVVLLQNQNISLKAAIGIWIAIVRVTSSSITGSFRIAVLLSSAIWRETRSRVKGKKRAWVKSRGFAFDPTPVNGNPAESIYINYPSKDSKVLWRFNADTGEYERYVGGEPFIDVATNQIISAPNVIIYFAPHYETDIVEDSTGATSVRIESNGEGRAWIFRDRTFLEGRWRTDGGQTPEFLDFEGNLIPLRPGQTWIQVVPLDYKILVNEIP